MIVNDSEALERIGSPLNLINRLRRDNKTAPKGLDIFCPSDKSNSNSNQNTNNDDEINVPSIDELLDKPEDKIKLATAHNSALDVMNNAIQELSNRLSEVKADKLPGVITAASKVVEGIRKERNDLMKARQGSNQVNYHFYIPEQRKISEYEVIEVNSSANPS